jgi:adenylate cyclase, class 2
MAIEIEKKYRLTPELRDEIAASLVEFGAEYQGEDFEENILFSNDQVFEKTAVVRIRKTSSQSTLSFKQRTQSNSDAKHQLEYESEISDADAVRIILENIGLHAVAVYEKRRSTYTLRSTEVFLDELPFGSFMEIEGSLTAIAEAEMLLGIEDLEVENQTYPYMTRRLGVQNGSVIEARFRS